MSHVPNGPMGCKTGFIKLDLVALSDSNWSIGRALKETSDLKEAVPQSQDVL